MRQNTWRWVALAYCLIALGCTVRSRRPDGAYRAAQEFADALSDEAVECVHDHAPAAQGAVVVAADCANAGAPPIMHDIGSMQGAEAALACVRKRAVEALKCPASTPARYVRVRVPVPLVTSEVTYAFMHELPR